jgi:hypothetical protein
MKFPDLNIIKEVDNDKKIGEYKTLLICHLDWSNLDAYNKSKHISWIFNLNKHESQYSKKSIDILIDEYIDWDEFNYPTYYKDVYKKFQYIKIPKAYYQEIEYFKKMAIDEFNKKRPFDTTVRERCLNPAIEAVDLFFHLIYDSLVMFNEEFRGTPNVDILKSLWLYRFWKHQTGSGMSVLRSTKDMDKFQKLIGRSTELKKVLNSNNASPDIKEYQRIIDNISIIIQRESKINEIIIKN